MSPIAALLVSTLVMQAQIGASQETGSVAGRVTNTVTGEMVPGASVSLILLRSTHDAVTPPTRTQADGTFRFEGVSPGNYVMTAERDGFVPNRLNSKSQMITVEAGQTLSDVSVQLAPEGSITGKIEDEDGTSIPGAQVEALAPVTTRGRTSLNRTVNATADSSGNFSLLRLPPAQYYVVAELPTGLEQKPNKEGELVRTIYPRSLDFDGGSAIPVATGQTVTDITIRVRRATTFHIRGKVVDPENTAGSQKVAVSLSPRRTAGSVALTKTVQTGSDRSFNFDGIVSGAYTLRVIGNSSAAGPSRRLLAREDVEIGTADLDRVTLSLAPPVTVTGNVTVDSTTLAAFPRVTVVAKPIEDGFHSTQASASVASDGRFSLNSLDPALYVINAFTAGSGMYVKSVSFNRREVLNKEVDLSQAYNGRLDIVLSIGAGEINGTVQRIDGSVAVTIVLVPDTVGPDGSGVLFTYSRSDGSFAVKNIRPGRYLAFAVERGDPNLWQNPEFLQVIEGQGTSVQVGEGSRQQIQLGVMPSDQIEQAARRLGLTIP